MTFVDVVAYIRTYVHVQLLHAVRMSHAPSMKLQYTARIRCACMCMHIHVPVCLSDLILSVFVCCRLYHDWYFALLGYLPLQPMLKMPGRLQKT